MAACQSMGVHTEIVLVQANEDLAAQQAANGHARADVEKRKGVLSATAQRFEEAKARMTAEGRQLGSLQQRIQVRPAAMWAWAWTRHVLT